MTMSVAQARGRTRLKPVFLIEITLQGAGAPVLYLSDRNITVGGQIYENYLEDLSGLAEEIERATSSSRNPDISLRYKNDRYGSHNYLIEIGDTYPWEGALTTIKEVYLDDDNTPSAVDMIFKGALDEPRDIDLMGFTCKASSMSFVKDRQWKQSLITKITYTNADPDDLNKVENIIYGHCEQVRCHAIKAGAVDSSTADVTATSPGNSGTLVLSDASELPSSGAFTLQWDSEQIRIASRSGDTLTLASSGARGYNSTTSAAHAAASPIFEVLTEYIYLVAKHPVKAIGDVYVDGVRQLSGFTKYTGQSGDAHADYAGKAVIAFTAKPVIQKQINVEVVDPAHGHSSSSSSPEYDYVYLDTCSASGKGNAYDGNLNTSVGIYSSDGTLTFRRAGSVGSDYATKIRARVKGIAGQGEYFTIQFFVAGIKKYEYINYNPPNNEDFELITDFYSISSWSNVYSSNTYITISSGGVSFYEIYYEVEHFATAPTEIGAASTGLSLSGASSADAVIGESINVDVDGYRDDGSGTYTGSANALIERPDHVFKHFIDILYGFALTDIDSSSFSAAGVLYAAAISGGYKFGACINSEITPSKFLADLAFQCRSNIRYEKGLWYVNYLPDTAPAVVRTISRTELAGQYAKFTFRKSDSVDIANDLTAKFKKNYGAIKYDESEWLGTSTASDSTSQGKYGIRARTFEFTAVRLQAMADHVLAFQKLFLKNPLLIVDFQAFWEYFDLVRGNTFDIDNPLYDAKKFYIEMVERIDKGTLGITGIEWPA